MKRNKYIYNVGWMFGWLLLLVSCSTTRNLPEDEVLYTGIKSIEVTDKDVSKAQDRAMEELDAALSYPPNNAFFGSSSLRVPFPMGLWIYNSFVNKKGKVGKWIFDTFAAKPVLLSTVNPEVRTSVARNILRENGYFDGTASYEVIPNKKNPRKAQLSFTLTMNHPYTYDSIRYMRMRSPADSLVALHMNKSLLHKGANFNVVDLEQERQRISSLLRNAGYYYYRPEYIVYQADTLMAPGKVWLRVRRAESVPSSALRPYKLGDISVWLGGYNNEPPTDSVRYKDLTIHYEGKLRVRPSVLYKRLRFQPGDLYTLDAQQRTQSGMSRLGIFRYTEMQYTPRDTTRRNDILNLRINTVYDLPIDGELEVNVTTKSNDLAGPGAIFGVTRRNVFHGGETFNVELRGSYEWQTNKRTSNNKSSINSYELGLSSTLTFPSVLFPGFAHRDLEYPSSTTFRIYGSQLNRARFFKMLSFGGSMTYDFQPTATTRHSITPFRLSYNLLQKTTADFDSIADVNPVLYLSLRDQFIPAMSYTYTYDDSPLSSLKNHIWWQTAFTQSGNILSGIYALAGKSFDEEEKKLLGNPFSQFVKLTSELRYNYRLDRNNRLVARVMAGAIYSYGNARVSPYSEQFYVGGANSVRAFTIRSIGPGRFKPDYENNRFAYIDQTGDLKLEANLEYRFRVAGDLYGATFLDAGGIWLLREDEYRPGGTFKVSRLLKDLALGTGFGFRYDLDFLVIRVDLGIGLHLPYQTSKKGYYNIEKFKDSLGLHLAVGYPF
ncbi:outer membrane protein assembly factor BamA [Parabacteroides sp. PF5-5]|uniref:translocation and assembly module lipoprotein TamL n=1 Tax=unclassified Parabacteroides TaxID=2649774 RepID=UPI002476483F|nr:MULTISPECIES: BamA/TamA family outer membrane protein [unclassified Parabacteroides]MDH6305724.1 outer membrane protein assembly factor BamA [Parabacteroides sp. PH5-39]MDH6316796.1 outer membrane protein assembly factor BamA [Parabacteroides sp. PF5-13]MDH6320437.1 outer membrane protein assembly factor BamA [Parabacteroides sp. PH5-13]MDH6324167.1 outer membrane protein assembly factor BamA [Parabacteroides sp. PH5-8]MDH6327982.1 outer membrane protein assembly factor BamA [Parabacteroide